MIRYFEADAQKVGASSHAKLVRNPVVVETSTKNRRAERRKKPSEIRDSALNSKRNARKDELENGAKEIAERLAGRKT